MSIYAGSRYAHGVIGHVTDAQGHVNTVVFRESTPRTLTVKRFYITIAGDRLDFLAARIYGRDDLWWLIADANADLLQTDPLPIGISLRIPDAPDDV